MKWIPKIERNDALRKRIYPIVLNLDAPNVLASNDEMQIECIISFCRVSHKYRQWVTVQLENWARDQVPSLILTYYVAIRWPNLLNKDMGRIFVQRFIGGFSNSNKIGKALFERNYFKDILMRTYNCGDASKPLFHAIVKKVFSPEVLGKRSLTSVCKFFSDLKAGEAYVIKDIFPTDIAPALWNELNPKVACHRKFVEMVFAHNVDLAIQIPKIVLSEFCKEDSNLCATLYEAQLRYAINAENGLPDRVNAISFLLEQRSFDKSRIPDACLALDGVNFRLLNNNRISRIADLNCKVTVINSLLSQHDFDQLRILDADLDLDGVNLELLNGNRISRIGFMPLVGKLTDAQILRRTNISRDLLALSKERQRNIRDVRLINHLITCSDKEQWQRIFLDEQLDFDNVNISTLNDGRIGAIVNINLAKKIPAAKFCFLSLDMLRRLIQDSAFVRGIKKDHIAVIRKSIRENLNVKWMEQKNVILAKLLDEAADSSEAVDSEVKDEIATTLKTLRKILTPKAIAVRNVSYIISAATIVISVIFYILFYLAIISSVVFQPLLIIFIALFVAGLIAAFISEYCSRRAFDASMERSIIIQNVSETSDNASENSEGGSSQAY
jgi:VIT1/CCC1 family predicted Fe2+/Mn2+ transporter